jgi:hypothetical protein
MSFEETKAHYNGYHLIYNDKTGHHKIDVYSPKSVVEAMLNQEYKNYWNKTQASEALESYITINFKGLKDIVLELMAGGSYRINEDVFQDTVDSPRDADNVLAILVHLGYLTYDGDTATVSIPNREVSAVYVKWHSCKIEQVEI